MGAAVIGRHEEKDTILSLLSSVADGHGPAGIVLTGEAGIGKTTLWEAGVEAGREGSFRLLVARPAEPEAKLSFSGVGDLLDPFLEDVRALLPPPQRRALEVALLVVEAEGRAPEPRAVAVAFLGALRALARASPILVAVDDFQWLDAPSESVLRFAARRLADERVALLVTQRAPTRGLFRSTSIARCRATASLRYLSARSPSARSTGSSTSDSGQPSRGRSSYVLWRRQAGILFSRSKSLARSSAESFGCCPESRFRCRARSTSSSAREWRPSP